jgi:hypothetical protein
MFTARPQRVVIGSETRALRLTNFLVDLRRRILTTSRSLLGVCGGEALKHSL